MNDGSVGAQDELRLVSVGDIQEKFLVPAYQRGYRWGKEQVTVLLDDLHEIQDKNYCLQPVVVKRLPDGRFELIDGQQRLTTLYLLFLYMQKEGFKKSGPPFTIEYKTRPKSGSFLANPDAQTANDNIDFFHLFGALDAIRKWFQKYGHRTELVAGKIYGHLFERVKVIWYEDKGEDAAGLFTRLNVGRIPLTNAELVKALLLAKGRADHGRQIEIATQWDTIERELHDRDFWSFLSNSPGESYPTRIQLLFDLIAETPAGADPFHTFFHFKNQLEAKKSADDVWGEVSARYAQLREWYQDRDLYHQIGFLIATGRGGELATLIRESKDKRKSLFQAELVEKIGKRLALSAEDLAELEYEDREKCGRALLLFNVETTRTLKNSLERYPFAPSKNHSWSLEHIHAQNAEGLNKKYQWEAWLRDHAKALKTLRRPGQEAAITQLEAEIEVALKDVGKETFPSLAARITELFNASENAESIHGIANLALLSAEANSTLNNAVFEVKRQRILEMDRRGEYIPICTRRVFLKYYTDSGDQQLQFWSTKDREAYLSAMRTMLDPYLTRSAE